MLRNKIYYQIKPFVPQVLRTAIRRRFALRLRDRAQETWPIMPGSERAPDGWRGWPKNKKFALVLTHDVEGPAGLNKCRRLMQLEMELGFRSSFNFIPEGKYPVPADLREELAANGFEVGVHDLKHDGRLYRSRPDFNQKARRINHYLKEWNATGFRSGFMLHNLNWLHELEIQYDMSTFDTDPFEPQPEGRDTIFPFLVRQPTIFGASAPGGPDSYLELPYTLPQDSTLFLLLREATPEIWIRKLDWIAQHGGMALVNVHPDYVRFDDEDQSRRTYPIAHYRQLLEHVRRHHENAFWQPVPRALASFVAGLETPPEVVRQAKRICMVTHSFYESDNRVTRYAAALAARGDTVDVVALRRSPELLREETIEGVNLFRIQDRFGKTERTRFSYLWPLLRFLKGASRWVTRRHASAPYDLLHIHNVPDFMVFAAWYPKLTGARVILDIHDIVPEFYASKFGILPRGMTFALLRWMERASAAFAHHVIIANDLWLGKYAQRTATNGRCTAFINNVDSSVFTRQTKKRQDGKHIILFPGGLQWHQGVDIALRAFAQVRAELPNCEFHIYGDGNARESLIDLTATLGLNGSVRFFKPTSVREIAGVMAEADLGVVPKRADSFGNEAYSTKIMEFMAVGVPVVVSSTKVDRHYFNDSVVRFFPSGDADALAGQMLGLLRDTEMSRQMVERASEYAATHCWKSRKDAYLNLVDSLCATDVAPPSMPRLTQKAA